MGIDPAQLYGNPVMLPQPERVHGGQPWLLIHPVVTRVEAVKVGGSNSAFFFSRFGI